MEAYANVDVFVGNDIFIDQHVFQLWLDGYSAVETVHIMKKRGVMEETGIPLEVLKSDIHNHFKLFDMLEPLLQQPPRFEKQLKFQILPEMQRMIIENYYKFDDCVIREILGKKLSSKTRKELDDVSERSRVNLKSCRRQFENMKHVFKAVEEMRGSLEQNVQQSFLLPIELARKYAAVVFITSNRFETGKKKLAYLEFDDFAHCANLMITNWSCASADCQREDMLDVDFDRDFLQDLKDLKILLDRDLIDEHKGITCRNLKARLSEKVCNDLQANFKTLSRSLVNIACNLIHSKELRDLFVDLVETFIETCRGARICYDDVRCFLEEYQQAVKSMELIKRSNLQIYGTWDRYMNTVSSCLLQLYHI